MTPAPADALAGLYDVVVPQAVSLLPATPAWVVGGVLAVALVAWLLLRALRGRQRGAYRREAAAVLRGIEARLGSTATRDAALTELPVFVKRVALQLAPREEIAALSGPSWMAFLDRTWKGEAFGKGPGRVLPEIAYGTPERRRAIGPEENAQILALLRSWIRGHHAPSPGAQQREEQP